MSQIRVQLRGVSRYFGGTTALENVDFQCGGGGIHGVLGENGAGKSTLIKILAGALGPSVGELLVDDKVTHYPSTAAAARDGIVCVFQELSLIPDLSVADNICIDTPPRRFGFISTRRQRLEAERTLSEIRCDNIDPDALVRDLSLSQQQLVEIAKAVRKQPRLLILDEATSALTAKDVQTVYQLLEELRARQVSCLFISHRMQEVEALCDRLSVFRNGKHIDTFNRGRLDQKAVIQLMIGREFTAQFPPKPDKHSAHTSSMSVENLRWQNRLQGIDFDLAGGEIVGLGGLDGQGHKELMLGLFGVLKGVEGDISVGGKPYQPTSPANSKHRSVVLVPEDRKSEGLLLNLSIGDNLLLPNYRRVSTAGVINKQVSRQSIQQAIEKLQIKVHSADEAVGTLSGGNQQKVVIAKWLMQDPSVILLNDPSRGIDVGTKQEIYRLMRELADCGKAILFYSTDYTELIGCCDRVLVMYDGQVVAELKDDTLTEEAIVSASLNVFDGQTA